VAARGARGDGQPEGQQGQGQGQPQGHSQGHSIDQLSAYLEGELSGRAAEVVRAHLEGCAACAGAAADLKAIVAGARRLDRPEPPPTLWSSIEGALAQADAAPPLGAWRRFFVRGFAMGGLAGAAAVVLIGLGVLAARGALHGAGAPVAAAPAPLPAAAADPMLEEAETELRTAAAAYERSIEKLRTLLASEESRWSPDARARCAERLARLDEAIARSRDAARSTPGDSAGNEILFAAYRSKIDYLAEVVHRGGPAPIGEAAQ
jgi:hypothetical protein